MFLYPYLSTITIHCQKNKCQASLFPPPYLLLSHIRKQVDQILRLIDELIRWLTIALIGTIKRQRLRIDHTIDNNGIRSRRDTEGSIGHKESGNIRDTAIDGDVSLGD